MATKKKASTRKTSKATNKKVEGAMRARKKGTLTSGSGKKVKSRKQAIAIGLSEARREGKKAPPKKTSTSKKAASPKRTSAKKTSSPKKASSKKPTSRKAPSSPRS